MDATRTYYLKGLDSDQIIALIGENDSHLNLLSSLYHTDLLYRGDFIKIFSEDEKMLSYLFEELDILSSLLKKKGEIDSDVIRQVYHDIHHHTMTEYQNEVITYTQHGKPVKAKTYHQSLFIEKIDKNDLVFAIGPAGTGKTFMAILMAVRAYKRGEIKKIVLTRPAVEAGESLGFLPGDLKEKVDPYLMPLYDSLHYLLGREQVEKLLEKGDIEIIPLAFMRGRTLNDAYIILDEAQNTTAGQMLMFLTRLGKNSKMIVGGDITQIDLDRKVTSGLILARERLRDIPGIDFVEFDGDDIVRNPLVQKIIENYHV
ncbi:MAG: PhoH family protein [Erysipelotrichaceae bacterium]|nr:PhoH family protein [Erysipelotrichaceae bacterium]